MFSFRNCAFLLIDMQRGFVEPDGGLCIAGAQATLPACARALQAARGRGVPVVHVRRRYAQDGSDVEPGRLRAWLDAGRPISDARPDTLEPCPGLQELPGEPVVMKPSWSAFDRTGLQDLLEGLGTRSVVLAGTTTPNCIRSTCYDAMARGFDVAVLADATSSRTPQVQQANLEDMAAVGARITCVDEALVRDSLAQGQAHGFKILQFNAVVASNKVARHLYRKLGFVQLGAIPGGFRMPDGRYEDIVPYYHEL